MTPGIGLALLAMVCFGAGDLIYKRAAAAGIEARHFVMLQAWGFCPSVTLYAIARHELVLAPAALWGSLAGLVMFFALYNFSRSLRSGAVSTNAPIFRLSFTLTAALAVWLLDEPLTPTKVAGLGLACVAVVALVGDTPDEAVPTSSDGSLTRVLLATVAAGIGNLLYKVGLRAGSPPETLLATQAWVFCSLATLVVWLSDGRVSPPRAGFRHGALVAVVLLVGFVALLHGLAIGHASVVVPIAQLGFVLTALLGRVLFGEPLSSRKQAGLAIAAAAIVTLALG
jgi:drug/metabolite transporter (DMT)-like permease